MEIANEVIESMLIKFNSERKWTLQAIGQLSEEDLTWVPNSESNSITNLVAHIRGCVHSRIETIFYDIQTLGTETRNLNVGSNILKSKFTT